MKILIAYSGGKDSQACLIWAVKEYGVENCTAVFCDTGWENPVTYEHIVSTCKQLNVNLDIIKNNKYNGLVDLSFKKKRFPSTKARFCTEELKLKPMIDYVLSKTEHLIIIEGIRRDESHNRSKMEQQCTYFKYYFEPMNNSKKDTYRKKDVLKWCEQYNADKLRPIFHWNAQETIDYIRNNGQEPNPLYFMGFHRVGCFPCIMSRHRAVKLIIENHPEQWQILKDAEKLVGTTFFHSDYIPKHAQTGKSIKWEKLATAEDVERYLLSKDCTIDMFKDDTPSCMSVYNLCE